MFYQKSLNAGVSHYLVYHLDKELTDCDSVLDIGCGANSQIQVCSIPYTVGVDMFKQYLYESKRKGLHTQYILCDVSKLELKEKSFDAVVAFELIEHLTKEEGYELIQNMERWARKKVIISTPKGYVHQDAYHNNPFQQHKSGWDIGELEKLGFKVYGACGWQALKGREGNKARFKPELFWQTISSFTSVILACSRRGSLTFFSNISDNIFCI